MRSFLKSGLEKIKGRDILKPDLYKREAAMFVDTGVTLETLARDGRKVARRGGKQVLLLLREGRVFALANRCPHEGFPLSEGTEGPGCVLTCNWHNWKFDLATGAALVGRDPVRVYAVELRDGAIFADLSDPPAQAQRARALDGLLAAVRDNDHPRMAREAARLERAGFAARDGLAHAIAAQNDRLEYGMTHAHAAAADWLALAARAGDDDKRLAAAVEPIAHLAWDTLGAGHHPYADGVAEWDAAGFVAAIEAEDEAKALAHLRGALWAQVAPDAVFRALGRAALAHYADFGHSAIYVLKTRQLIEALDGESAEPLLFALTRALVSATREERLPEFRAYARALSAWDGTGDAPAGAETYRGANVEAALRLTLAASGRPPRETYDTLLEAAAWNLLHFDTAVDRATDNAIADNASWLDFTHALTFANATRHICETQPDLWPAALLQLALFVGRNKAYVDGAQDTQSWRVDDVGGFIRRGQESLYDHGIVEPIIACHRVKMLFALEDELDAAPEAPWRHTMAAAMNRWLATPQKRHHGLRFAAQARDFVAREG
jgi:nitrite reductase/ring-hydroxylating ferredoxin subunit